MNCDRGEKVSSYFKLEPQTQNKQIKNANGFSAEQMRPRCPDGACYNLSRGIPSDESSGDNCQSFYLKTENSYLTLLWIYHLKWAHIFFWSVLSWFWAWWHLPLIVMKPEIPALLICILIVTSLGDNDENMRVLEVMRDCIEIIRLQIAPLKSGDHIQIQLSCVSPVKYRPDRTGPPWLPWLDPDKSETWDILCLPIGPSRRTLSSYWLIQTMRSTF